jgi:hypothetical protein
MVPAADVCCAPDKYSNTVKHSDEPTSTNGYRDCRSDDDGHSHVRTHCDESACRHRYPNSDRHAGTDLDADTAHAYAKPD